MNRCNSKYKLILRNCRLEWYEEDLSGKSVQKYDIPLYADVPMLIDEVESTVCIVQKSGETAIIYYGPSVEITDGSVPIPVSDFAAFADLLRSTQTACGCCGATGNTSGDSNVFELMKSVSLASNPSDENPYVSDLELLKTNGNTPVAGDVLDLELSQGGQLIASAVYAAGADIDFVNDAPVSTTGNSAFLRPDGSTVDFVDWVTAVQPWLENATYTHATGAINIEKFDKHNWAVTWNIFVGPMDGFSLPEFDMQKVLKVTLTDGVSGKKHVYELTIDPSSLWYDWSYVTHFDVQTYKLGVGSNQGLGMAVVVQPDGGIYLGNIWNEFERFQPIIAGPIDVTTPPIPEGPLTRQDTIAYWWSCSIDQNFAPLNASNVALVKRFLVTAPRAWAGPQTCNDRLYLITPNNTNQNNAIGSLEVTHIAVDEGSPELGAVTGFFDVEETSGNSNIWATGTYGEFYRMDWNGSTWVKSSPANFTNATITNGIIFDILHGTNTIGEDWMLVCWRDTVTGYEMKEAWFYLHDGVGNKNDPASWTASQVFAPLAKNLAFGGLWDTGLEGTNNLPTFKGIRNVDGTIVQYEWDGANWVETVISADYGDRRLEEVIFAKQIRLRNHLTGGDDAYNAVLAGGRKGYNSVHVGLYEYSLEGEQGALIHQGKRLRSGAGFNFNIIY